MKQKPDQTMQDCSQTVVFLPSRDPVALTICLTTFANEKKKLDLCILAIELT